MASVSAREAWPRSGESAAGRRLQLHRPHGSHLTAGTRSSALLAAGRAAATTTLAPLGAAGAAARDGSLRCSLCGARFQTEALVARHRRNAHGADRDAAAAAVNIAGAAGGIVGANREDGLPARVDDRCVRVCVCVALPGGCVASSRPCPPLATRRAHKDRLSREHTGRYRRQESARKPQLALRGCVVHRRLAAARAELMCSAPGTPHPPPPPTPPSQPPASPQYQPTQCPCRPQPRLLTTPPPYPTPPHPAARRRWLLRRGARRPRVAATSFASPASAICGCDQSESLLFFPNSQTDTHRSQQHVLSSLPDSRRQPRPRTCSQTPTSAA